MTTATIQLPQHDSVPPTALHHHCPRIDNDDDDNDDSHQDDDNDIEDAKNRRLVWTRLARDVWVHDILGSYLRDAERQAFLASFIIDMANQGQSEESLQRPATDHRDQDQSSSSALSWSRFYESLTLDFCPCHGTRKESTQSLQRLTRPLQQQQQQQQQDEPESYDECNDDHGDHCDDHDDDDIGNHPKETTTTCPKCWQDAWELERCQACRVFFAPSDLHDWRCNVLQCQCCRAMVYCHECLQPTQNNDDGNGNDNGNGTSSAVTMGNAAQEQQQQPQQGHHKNKRSTTTTTQCTAGCCPSPWTNTLCGDYLCQDCRTASSSSSILSTRQPLRLSCHVCRKTTCLDPHCLVCENHCLLHQILVGNDDDDDDGQQQRQQRGPALALALVLLYYLMVATRWSAQ